MQPNETERRQQSRREVDQGFAPQQQDSETFVPSFLTARELQAWDPSKSADRRVAGDRRLPSGANVRRVTHDDE